MRRAAIAAAREEIRVQQSLSAEEVVNQAQERLNAILPGLIHSIETFVRSGGQPGLFVPPPLPSMAPVRIPSAGGENSPDNVPTTRHSSPSVVSCMGGVQLSPMAELDALTVTVRAHKILFLP